MINEKQLILNALEEKAEKLRSELEQIESLINKTKNELHSIGSDATSLHNPQRKYKWNNIVLSTFKDLNRLVETKKLYDRAIKLYPEIQSLTRRKLISGLSGSVSTLKSKGKLKVLEEKLSGIKLYGLPEWFHGDSLSPKDLFYISLVEDNYNPKSFDLAPPHQHSTYIEDAVEPQEELDDLPF